MSEQQWSTWSPQQQFTQPPPPPTQNINYQHDPSYYSRANWQQNYDYAYASPLPSFRPTFPPPPSWMPPMPPLPAIPTNVGLGLSSFNSFSIQRENDQDWVQEWLKKLNKPAVCPCRPKSRLSVPEVKSTLQDALTLLQELTQLHNTLTETVASGGNMWKYRCQRAAQIKEKLNEFQVWLFPKESELVIKLNQIRNRRARKRRRNELLLRERKERTLRREELTTQLDTWQKNIYQEDERVRTEQKLKAEADVILTEVRKKQLETKKAIDLVESLQKLRQLRKQAAERKGLFTTKESDEIFASKMTFLGSMLERQEEDYMDEEKALRVMLDSNREAEQQQMEQQLEDKVVGAKKELLQSLFGNLEPISPDDPLYSHWLYYIQAERNFELFLRQRRDWDSFSVSAEDPEGSSIPVQWLIPKPPSSDEWAKLVAEHT